MSTVLQAFNPTSYEFRARTRPILFISVPLALSVWIWTSGRLEGAGWIISLLVAAGVPYVLGEWAADRGRARERDLWRSWGGAPTTQILRHGSAHLNPHTRRQVHAALQRFSPDLPLPSLEAEVNDSLAADALYGAHVDRLRVAVRDSPDRFAVAVTTNADYGFRRNLWAIKWWGVAAAVVGGGAAILHLIVFGPGVEQFVAIGGSASLLSFLLTTVHPLWVRDAAFRYAHRLIECVDRIQP